MRYRFDWLNRLVRLTGSVAVLLTASLGMSADGEKLFTQQPEILQSRQGQEVVGEPPAAAKPVVSNEVFNQGPVAQWIWGANQKQNYVLQTKFSGPAKLARLKAVADNVCTIWINGKKVLKNENWMAATEADVTQFVTAGENVLQAEVVNSDGPAAFLLKLALVGEDGKANYVVSDAGWKSAAKRDATEFADVRIVGKLGDKPYGDPLEKSTLEGQEAPEELFNLLPGFQVERLFTVPKDVLGSWVSMTFDPKGRLLVCDQQDKGLCRVTLPAIGSKDPVKVERLDVKISAAQGMLCAFDALYLSVNGGPGSGFYRAKDTDGDDLYDEVVLLQKFDGGGEHGPHSLRLSPDGKSIYVVCGNHTKPPQKIDASRLPTNWSEDLLLPRHWDPSGHARGILAPGGWLAKTDPEGKTWEILSSGYRNQFDFALNADNEIFVYDADMEYDFGAPWYRPTRVNHATSGSELGWRSGTGKWPAYYIDGLPAAVDIGPGSPVGVTFGYGAKFPAKYQKALFICDWTFGTMYAIHFEPEGSTYKGVKEEFVSRTPLPLTDNAIGPDGAMYFTIGGRGTQSELFRVTYVGKESTDPVDAHDTKFAEERAKRRQIEEFHRPVEDGAKAVEFVYPFLSSPDRFMRYAARVALENQKPELWQTRVLAETNPVALIEGVVGLARQGDKSLQPQLLAALEKVDFNALAEQQQLGYLRALSLVFVRMGEPTPEISSKFIAKLDPFFPGDLPLVNRELCSMLVYLQSPTIVPKTLKLLEQPSPERTPQEMSDLLARNKGYGGTIAAFLKNAVDPQKFHYGFVLRNAKVGWTMDLRKAYFKALNEFRTKNGGASFQGFINYADRDFFDNATDAERLAIEATGLRKPFVPKELPKAAGPGKDYTLDEIVAGAAEKLKSRDFKNGQKMFAAARCVVCHRFFGDGGATGPDLSQAAGRFQLKDLAEAIVEPSKIISDQYRGSIVVMESGKVFSGKIVSETKDDITIVLNPEDSTKVEVIKKTEIEETKPLTVSLMPKDLLKELNENEVYDLLAYLLARGNEDHALFKK